MSCLDKPVLEVKGLTTEFPTPNGAFHAVNDVSITLYPGKTLCIVGESGSGKSVLSKSIMQIVDRPGRISAGQVLLHRDTGTIDIATLNDRGGAIRSIRGKDVAMIFQEPMSSLSPVHTIGEQIGEVLRLHERMSRKQARQRTIELLRQVEIPNPEVSIDRYPFEYSGGMRQRAVIAMALACNPAILIADEPTTALDLTIQAEILALIKSLQEKRNMAVLFITHDMSVVAEIADEIVVMRLGKVVESGCVFDVFENPRHDYTKSLLNAVRGLDRPSPRRLAMRDARPIGEPILVARSVTKAFGPKATRFNRNPTQFLAVDAVDLDLMSGENLGIVGESGSGKTTLGRCLQRVYDPSAGSILYQSSTDGQIELVGMRERDLRKPWRDIRTVFQDPFGSLNPRMTIGQIVAEPLLVAGDMTEQAIRGRVCELLDMVGLPSSAMSRYPHAFSGGQRQRVSVARAIAPKPRVIIADEATSALDVNLRTQILDLMLELQQQLGLSYVLISHDIAVVRYFCDRTAVMHRGKMVEIGPTEAICSNPVHPYTQSLLSAVLIADPRQRGNRVRTRYMPEVATPR
ncbi:ABC transporter ATP-binding protein [Agrobacterium sp. NPDC089420]|uniref:ABC transporter ATP-binding protein n=1 Tax=Agrobacterium sp. NPDC089420 TaxID=3363918 RepID=UPI00384EEDB2